MVVGEVIEKKGKVEEVEVDEIEKEIVNEMDHFKKLANAIAAGDNYEDLLDKTFEGI